MGRLEWLTALTLGRGLYDAEVIETVREGSGQRSQLYNDRGYPRNPESRRRERENVRAANEVMQVTGVVEDSLAAKAKKSESEEDRLRETLLGLRLLEVGRSALIGGVWGVIGLRRRILLYKPYSELRMSEILKQEAQTYSVNHLLFWGLAPVIAYHVSDWMSFILEAVVESAFDLNNENEKRVEPRSRRIIQGLLEVGACYITVHFRMFAVLQQLNLLPSSRFLPSIRSFIPFSDASPFQLPPVPSLTLPSLLTWCSTLLRVGAPMLTILVHGKIKYAVSKIAYRPIYKALPRPTGDSMFSGLEERAPTLEYDAPDQDRESRRTGHPSEDEPTLRALEGLPESNPPMERGIESADEDDDELTHATLISFDVEATEAVETSLGTWSAELRSANEPKTSEHSRYRVTGLTMLPTIMATEGLRDIVASILVMPLEALMVRVIGRDYQISAGLGVEDLYGVNMKVNGFSNLFATLTFQLAATGAIWAGFTLGAHMLAVRRKANLQERAEKESSVT